MRRALELFELERSKPSRFRVEDGEVVHSHCDAPMTLVQRALSGEERWFCTTCRESVYLPQEAWLFLMEQLANE